MVGWFGRLELIISKLELKSAPVSKSGGGGGAPGADFLDWSS